jgi:hypothetical protein
MKFIQDLSNLNNIKFSSSFIEITQCLNTETNRLSLRWEMAVPSLRRLVDGFPQRGPWFETTSGHVGFVVDEVALGQDFSKYFGFPCQFSFHRLLHIHHHLSSGARTVGQIVDNLPNGLSLTPPKEIKKIMMENNHCSFRES